MTTHLHGFAVQSTTNQLAPIPEFALMRKLGVAFFIWLALIDNCDSEGTVTLTAAEIGGIPGYESFCKQAVTRALKRLEAAGLVKNEGWQTDSEGVRVGLFVRRVFGRRDYDFAGTYWVPEATWTWYWTATHHGGSRQGAGRKPKPIPVPQECSCSDTEQCVNSDIFSDQWATLESSAEVKSQSEIQPCCCGKVSKESSRKERSYPYSNLNPTYAVTYSSPTGKKTRARGIFFGINDRQSERKAGPEVVTVDISEVVNPLLRLPTVYNGAKPWEAPTLVAGPDPIRLPKVHVAWFPMTLNDSIAMSQIHTRQDTDANLLGVQLGGSGYAITAPVTRPIHPAALGFRYPGVPDPVSVIQLGKVRVPDPPMLNPDDPPERHAFLLARWYTQAVEQQTGKVCWTFKKTHVTKSRYYALLVKVAKYFILHEIAPAAWCAFSVDVWAKYNDKGDKPPPVQWVFSTDRMVKREKWFWNANRALGGTLVLPESAKDLIARQAAMRSEIARSNPSDQTLGKIVQKYFPGDTFDRLCAQVKSDTKRMTSELRSRAQAGDWLW
jgi:hypothetical protein